MAVYRVQRTRDYTVMSNYHLKDKGLTLKSKGLLSMILSLPEEWNYTTRGLASICKEGVDALRSKSWKQPATLSAGSFAAQMVVLLILSTSFMSSHSQRSRICCRRMWFHQIRKTRIW